MSLVVLSAAVLVGVWLLRGRTTTDPAAGRELAPAALAAVRLALTLEDPDALRAELAKGPTRRTCWVESTANGPLWRVAHEAAPVAAPLGPAFAVELSSSGTAGPVEVSASLTPFPPVDGQPPGDLGPFTSTHEPVLRAPVLLLK